MFANHSHSHSRETASSKVNPHPSATAVAAASAAVDRIPRTLPSEPHPHPRLHHHTQRIGNPQKIVGADVIPTPIKRVPINNGRPRTTSNPVPATTASNIGRKREFLVEEQKNPISLDGVVDLTNTVDTDVTTRTLPAVVHEHITPTRHEIIQKRITREIHHHDVYHRILPVIDTEVLPPRHYVYGPDGRTLHEIPEALVRARTHARNWQIVETHPMKERERDLWGAMMLGIPSLEIDSMDGKSQKYISTFQLNPRDFLRWTRNPTAPIKIMEREYMTAEGFPRKETWWRHPPTLETGAKETGQTVPMFWHWTDNEEELHAAEKVEGERKMHVGGEMNGHTHAHTNGKVSRRFSIPRKPIVHDDSLPLPKEKAVHSGGKN
ncbi:Alcohol dehydrogenase protein [Rutstroemia sp. NJR-2017a WRK4]|nr:Alcohol dehydrogenase protein [Rutstroemia sp. NJR-2017a WRK4]